MNYSLLSTEKRCAVFLMCFKGCVYIKKSYLSLKSGNHMKILKNCKRLTKIKHIRITFRTSLLPRHEGEEHVNKEIRHDIHPIQVMTKEASI